MLGHCRVTLIAAHSRDGFISRGQGIPWRLNGDVTHFRRYCAGKALLVGRRTYEEMDGWFQPNQRVFVWSRQVDWQAAAGHVVIRDLAQLTNIMEDELVVIGGAQIYAETLPVADSMLLTIVEVNLGKGISFPQYCADEWTSVEVNSYPADAENEFAYRIEKRVRTAVLDSSVVQTS
jgi:dihydrofolate reductase